MSNSIHTLSEFLPNSSKNSFESFNWHLNRPKILKQKINSHVLPSTIFEFTWLVIDGFMEENGLTLPFLKWKFGPPKISNFPSPSYAIRIKFFWPHKKYLSVGGWGMGGGIYTILLLWATILALSTNGLRYSIMDQVEFVEDSLKVIWSA